MCMHVTVWSTSMVRNRLAMLMALVSMRVHVVACMVACWRLLHGGQQGGLGEQFMHARVFLPDETVTQVLLYEAMSFG